MVRLVSAITECDNRAEVENLGEEIRARRKRLQWSQGELAELAGLNIGTVVNLERGGVAQTDTVKKIHDALTRGEGDLPRHTGTGEHDEAEPFDRDITRGYKKHDVPVIGDAEATTNGIISWSDEGIVKTQVEEWVSRAFSNGDPLAYALRVRGDSMVPRYLPGEVVIVQPRISPRDGDFAVVQLKNGERLVKRVFKTTNGWVLRSMNEAYPPREVSSDEVHAVHVIKHSVARM